MQLRNTEEQPHQQAEQSLAPVHNINQMLELNHQVTLGNNYPPQFNNGMLDTNGLHNTMAYPKFFNMNCGNSDKSRNYPYQRTKDKNHERNRNKDRDRKHENKGRNRDRDRNREHNLNDYSRNDKSRNYNRESDYTRFRSNSYSHHNENRKRWTYHWRWLTTSGDFFSVSQTFILYLFLTDLNLCVIFVYFSFMLTVYIKKCILHLVINCDSYGTR